MKNFSLLLILVVGLFLRLYKTQDYLGFWYDQGRDAQSVWNLIHHRDFFLIGPTTGIEGIFLGPFFYYLLTPFYWISGGDPVLPAKAMAVINIMAIVVIYKIGASFLSYRVGFLAATMAVLSYHTSYASRWLSNPTPLPLFGNLSLLVLLLLVKGQSTRLWIFLGLSVGLSLQLEAASAIFFIPSVVFSILALKRTYFKQKLWLTGTVALFITLLPQIVFNFRNSNLLGESFWRFLVSNKSFQVQLVSGVSNRLSSFLDIMGEPFFYERSLKIFFLVFLLCLGILVHKKLDRNVFAPLLIWCFLPFIALLFYHGNNGFVWSYYFTGVMMPLILQAAILLIEGYRFHKYLRIPILLVLTLFLYSNIDKQAYFLANGGTYITFKSIVKAVDWVFEDSKGQDFNVDVYLPSVVPTAYDYIFLWRGSKFWNKLPSKETIPLLYTLHEDDPGISIFKDNWLKRQAGIGTVVYSRYEGGITFERRTRLK